MFGTSRSEFRPPNENTYTRAEQPPQPNERQQRKITAVLFSFNPGFLESPDVSVTPQQEDVVRDCLAAGVHYGTPENVNYLLNSIVAPVNTENPGELFQQLESAPEPLSRQMRGLLAVLNSPEYIRTRGQDGSAFYARDNLDWRSIKELGQRYPSPAVYEAWAEPLLRAIESSNGVQKRREYERAVRVMGYIAYGKRWEYWEQIKLMRLQGNRARGLEHERQRVQSYSQRYDNSLGPEQEPREPYTLRREYSVTATPPQDESPAARRRATEGDYKGKLAPLFDEIRDAGRVPLTVEFDDKYQLLSVPGREPTKEEATSIIDALLDEISAQVPELNTKKVLKMRVLKAVRSDVYALPEIDRRVRAALMPVAVDYFE